jgi:CRISPR type III-B/RAMP module RAMP protein Cmr1
LTWIKLTLRVTTPVFNAGDNQLADAGVRPTSLRGPLRYWFRAFAGIHAGNDLKLLAGMERRIFGGDGQASPVTIRIPRQPAITTPDEARRTDPDFFADDKGRQWVSYMLGQGLTKYDRDDRRPYLTRPFVNVGDSFEIWTCFSGADRDAVGALALAALRLTCLYGGVGARPRRGFGGLRITAVTGDLPGPWTAERLAGPTPADYAGVRTLWPRGGLDDCGHVLLKLRDSVLAELRPHDAQRPDFHDDWPGPPPYPVLSKTWTVAGVSEADFDHWHHAVWYAGEELRYFRASEQYPAAPYDPKIKIPEWADVIHGNGDHFTVGALGLPGVFKEGYVVNADQGTGRRAEPLRRASPLWLRPVDIGDRWRLLSFAFLGRFLPGPGAPRVHRWHREGRRQVQDRELQVLEEDIQHLARQWIEAQRTDRSFERGTARRT